MRCARVEEAKKLARQNETRHRGSKIWAPQPRKGRLLTQSGHYFEPRPLHSRKLHFLYPTPIFPRRMRPLLLLVLILILMFQCESCQKVLKRKSGWTNHRKACSARTQEVQRALDQGRDLAESAKLARRGDDQVVSLDRQNLRDALNEVRSR